MMDKAIAATLAACVMLGGCATRDGGSADGRSAATPACQPVSEQDIAALFERWNAALQTGDPHQVVAHYAPGSILLLDGPFLLADPAGLDAVLHLQVSGAALRRALPPERLWWVEAFVRYRADHTPAGRSAAVIAYDHPAAPAIARADAAR